MISTDIIDNEKAFEALRDEWNELLHDSEADAVFLTWEWQFTWWRHLAEDRRLHLITIRQAGRLIGLAPVALRPRRWKRMLPFRVLEFLGSGNAGSDYLDVILRRGCEDEAVRHLAQCLSERKLVLELSHVDAGSQVARSLADSLQTGNWQLTRQRADVCPYIDLRGQDWEAYVNGLGRSHRLNFRKRMRRLERRFEVDFRPVTSQQERVEVFEDLVRLHLHRWEEKGGSDALHTPALVAFHRDITRVALLHGWLRLFRLRMDGRVVAVLYCFYYAGKYWFYQAGYDTGYRHYSVGLCAVGMAIRHALEEGAQEYDFLRGNEPYKYLWSTRERELSRIGLYPPSLKGRISRQAMACRDEIKKLMLALNGPERVAES